MNDNKVTGLVGRSLSHSMSPFLHSQMGDGGYRLFEIEPEELRDFILNGKWDFVNVTVPYKKDVVPFCTFLTSRAKIIGSVNTLIRRDGEIIGDNTDFKGFSDTVADIDFTEKKVVILGTGGVSLTVRKCAEMLGAGEILHISRNPQNTEPSVNIVSYSDTKSYEDADILINATPVGMFPDIDEMPISPNIFRNLSAVVDLIYNPLRTRLMLSARERGIYAVGGARMLCSQAHEARCVFGDIPEITANELERRLLRSAENISFIGMPGSGKSTLGRIISDRFHMKFIDTDSEIVRESGMTIPEIFRNHGEAYFRELEKEQIRRASLQNGVVIATGGGSILDEENRRHLMQSSFVIWLDCPRERLAVSGRPLSSSPEKTAELEKIRLPIYKSTADARVTVHSESCRNISQIISILEKHYRGESK